MSTQDPQPHDGPNVFDRVRAYTASVFYGEPDGETPQPPEGTGGDDGVDAPEDEPTDETPSPPRSQMRREVDPYGSTNDLGGTCPECSTKVDTRVTVRYDDAGRASLVLHGECRGSDRHTFDGEVGIGLDMTRPVH